MLLLMSKGTAMIKSLVALGCILLVIQLTGCETLHQPDHDQTITVSNPIKNIPITVSYQGGVFYHLEIINDLPTAINLLWDESTYVTTTGESVRILHLTNKSDLPKSAPAQQASTLIPPDSKFESDFTGDEWLDCARRNCTPHPKNSVKKAGISLAFKIKGKRVRWQGEVAFAPPKQP
jgi:hypothetical protein